MSVPKVLNASHHKREMDFYCANNPHGFGPDIYLFIHFSSPAVVVLDGVEYITDRGACIIYAPGKNQEYGHHEGIFINDFLIYESKDPHCSARYGLPENQLFYVADGDRITRQMELITYTLTDRLVDRSHETEQHVLKLFEVLSDLYVEHVPGLKRMFETKQRFITLRDAMRQNPKGWTVDKMAKYVWLTRSRFSTLYSEFFHISPNADLMDIRITYAKTLLQTTNMPIVDISAECGYLSVEHFIRTFSKKTGFTPLKYRKSV